MAKAITLRLSVEVSYDLKGTWAPDLEKLLLSAADHLAAEGLLSGGTAAEVTSWRANVEGIHSSGPTE